MNMTAEESDLVLTAVENYIVLIDREYKKDVPEEFLTRLELLQDISNQERALVATENNANLFIRLHADKANDSMTSGVRVFVPDSGDYVSSSVAWGDILGNKVSDRIGLGFIGTKSTSLYTGLNYANSVPSFQISLGLLSNSDDEAVLIDENNQVAISAAVAEFAYELK